MDKTEIKYQVPIFKYQVLATREDRKNTKGAT